MPSRGCLKDCLVELSFSIRRLTRQIPCGGLSGTGWMVLWRGGLELAVCIAASSFCAMSKLYGIPVHKRQQRVDSIMHGSLLEKSKPRGSRRLRVVTHHRPRRAGSHQLNILMQFHGGIALVCYFDRRHIRGAFAQFTVGRYVLTELHFAVYDVSLVEQCYVSFGFRFVFEHVRRKHPRLQNRADSSLTCTKPIVERSSNCTRPVCNLREVVLQGDRVCMKEEQCKVFSNGCVAR